ncbi:MAG TPA: response regulator transcription factor, partial [Casimicrobiaceae bacterium]
MIRILIADDHAIVRAGLKQFIADHADMQVAAEAATGTEAIAAVRAQEFDVVLLDISMPDKNGIDTLKTIKHVRPELPVLMLSAYAEDQYAVNLLRAGAAGYLNKEAASSQLVSAIRTVVLGRKFVSPSLAQIL